MHLADQSLVESGILALRNLVTIRQGEPSYDNIAGKVVPAETDIIKIQAVGSGDAACMFLRQDAATCEIYENRPLECRVLECWDSRGITDSYRKDRLTRRHLLEKKTELWDLVQDHQDRCDYVQFGCWADDLKKGRETEKSAGAMMSMMRYDFSLRRVMVESAGLDDRLLMFLLGRPVQDILGWFQLKIVRKDSLFTIESL